jgi:hypothetical protein
MAAKRCSSVVFPAIDNALDQARLEEFKLFTTSST